MRTTDNNGGYKIADEEFIHKDNLIQIANKNLIELQKSNADLLVFPHSLGIYRDDVEKSTIFSIDEETITTYNLMGFVGCNNSQLTITSRFAKEDNKDYFLHYMLQKVFAINLLDFDQKSNKENIWDFLIYLFPYFLKKAYTQGMFKAYKRNEYNNANIKGTININRHIQKNIPFRGNIAYSTREHSYDNDITQLIRHTIEFIKVHPFGKGVLTKDNETREIVQKFIFVTDATFSKSQRNKIIAKNLKSFAHPYFFEYKILQKICLQILRREKLSYGKDDNKIYGLLFDGAWLWEEYLNTILKDKFIHPENKTGKHKHYLFEGNKQSIYPDFISKDKPFIVGDAKYIPLDKQGSYNENSERAVSIYYKTLAYMYRFNSTRGFLIYPTKNQDNRYEELKIQDTDGVLKKIGLAIPHKQENFKKFTCNINVNELNLISKI
ncbi:McrC family protein [Myroides marinus]|uniref:McrC family protein n=1 Tax=Myroides marinus TaxID=703342 RepID=UPI0025782EE4|nr:restriction endonuclease [Myroides marinus]MDM1348940.1 restriction endonuclease [Myroides marinus]